MKRYVYLFALGLFLTTGCKQRGASSEVKVSSPDDVFSPEGNYPSGSLRKLLAESVARIDIFFDDVHTRCSGTFVGSDKVLTAAHCFYDDSGTSLPVDRIEVRLGKESFAADVIGSAANPGDVDDAKDLAILRLSRKPVGARALNIIESSDVFVGGAEVYSGGFGVYASDDIKNGKGFPDKLAIRKFLTTEEKDFSDISKVKNLTAAPISGEGTICGGDSGGPVVVKEGDYLVIIGVVTRHFITKDCEKSPRFGFVNLRSNISNEFLSKYVDVKKISLRLLKMISIGSKTQSWTCNGIGRGMARLILTLEPSSTAVLAKFSFIDGQIKRETPASGIVVNKTAGMFSMSHVFDNKLGEFDELIKTSFPLEPSKCQFADAASQFKNSDFCIRMSWGRSAESEIEVIDLFCNAAKN